MIFARGMLWVVACLCLTGCSSWLMSMRAFDVNERVYANQPLWKSSQIVSCTVQETGTVRTLAESVKLLAEKQRGLAMIVLQVFAQEVGALDQTPTPLYVQTVNALKEEKGHLLAYDANPLPEEIKGLNVTKVIIRSAVEQSLQSNCVTAASEALPTAPVTLSAKDFFDFGEAAAKSLVSPYQSASSETTRARANKAGLCAKGPNARLLWECIFESYMVAYYNGTFVDRNGGTQTKPKLGLTISNEAITAAVDVLLEATFDMIGIELDFVKAPIVYTDVLLSAPSSLGELTWATGKGGFPNKGTYGYEVTAVSAIGESLPSLEVQASVNVTDTVVLSWASVPGAKGYNVYRTAKPGTYTSPALVGSTSVPNYNDVGGLPMSGAPPATNTAIANVAWFTSGGNTPTLATLAISLGLFDPKSPKDIDRVLMKADAATMDSPRVCVSRLVGGWSGDAAQPLVGSIVRLFGGANLGFTFGLGALGKFSFGDNETLARVVDHIVEDVARRLGEMTVESVLYGDAKNAAQPLKDLLTLAENLSSCQGKDQ